MRIYMQIPPAQGKPPRFYHLMLQRDLLGGWSLVREWGNQGGPGRVKRDHHETRESAQEAMMRLRDERLESGYLVVFMQGDQQANE